jgi:hypothetical protein
MQNQNEVTVIFRVEKDGSILAVFPYEIWDNYGNVMCYAHIGQHSSCDYGSILEQTKPASPEQYQNLLSELKDIYQPENKIIVRKRRNYDMYLSSYRAMRA